MIRSFAIATFLIVFGSICGMLNASGIFDVNLPGSEYSRFNEQTVSKLTAGAAAAETNPFGGLSSIVTLASSVFAGVIQGLLLAPLMTALGVPWWVALPLSTPIWFIYGIDLLNWWGNRQTY